MNNKNRATAVASFARPATEGQLERMHMLDDFDQDPLERMQDMAELEQLRESRAPRRMRAFN